MPFSAAASGQWKERPENAGKVMDFARKVPYNGRIEVELYGRGVRLIR
jgi:hypothetical protein